MKVYEIERNVSEKLEKRGALKIISDLQVKLRVTCNNSELWKKCKGSQILSVMMNSQLFLTKMDGRDVFIRMELLTSAAKAFKERLF